MELSVYIVEDNQLLLDAITEALEETLSVRWLGNASGAPTAIAWLKSHPDDWQLLLVDLFLEAGTGLDVVAQCAQRGAGQKVVVITNYATPDIRSKARELGADAVFDKSTELEEMLEYCATLCGE